MKFDGWEHSTGSTPTGEPDSPQEHAEPEQDVGPSVDDGYGAVGKRLWRRASEAVERTVSVLILLTCDSIALVGILWLLAGVHAAAELIGVPEGETLVRLHSMSVLLCYLLLCGLMVFHVITMLSPAKKPRTRE